MRTETLLVAGGLAVVVGGTLLWSAFGGDANRGTTEAVVMIAPPADEDADAPATGALPPPAPETSPNYVPVTGPAEYMVTTRLTSIHGSPSATAPVLYAFPAGRRLRVAGREAGFARIEDLQSKATGWADERLLAPSSATASVKPTAPSAPSVAAVPDADSEPASAPAPAAAKPPPKPAATPPKPRVVTETEAAAAAQKQAAKRAQQRAAQRAARDRGLPGFLNRAFGPR